METRQFLCLIVAIGLLLMVFYSENLKSLRMRFRAHDTLQHRQHNVSNLVYAENILNPPKLEESVLQSLLEMVDSNPQVVLRRLSRIVNEQIIQLQNSSNCAGNSVSCGHFDDCGFACQIHHRAACLMISYAMGLPLIHDTKHAWPFSTRWDNVFLALGSDCPVGNHAYSWTWKHKHEYYVKPYNNSNFGWNINARDKADGIPFPLFSGIVVSSPIAEIVERIHRNPFQWWASQFILHSMRYQPKIKERIDRDQDSIGLDSDCIGFHVRRTDKQKVVKSSFHELNEYFKKAKESGTVNGTTRQQVFLASDDSSLLSKAKNEFADWDVVGYNSNTTKKTQAERRDSLYDIIRDVASLAKCKTVVCGFSSNVCRLIFEIQRGSDMDPKLVAIDGVYVYEVYAVHLKPAVNKVHPY